MSYPKKNVNKNVNTKPGAKLPDDKREKLLKIQEREQLKGLLVNKFLEKYAKNPKADQEFVQKQVNDFMKNEKLTEENLKRLEQQITAGVNAKNQPPKQFKEDTVSVRSQQQQAPQFVHHNEGKHVSHAGHHHAHDDDGLSITSSQKPKSVYAQGDSDDEWATMLKYDTELYKHEKVLERVKEQEQKRRNREELDRQIEEKRYARAIDDDERKRYNGLVEDQLKVYDNREHRKEKEMQSKILQEKLSRDKQLQDENLRKKLDKRVAKDMDNMLVNQIKKELDDEVRQAVVKRAQDRENLKRVLIENEEYKKKMAEEARREKELDTKAQREYTRLIEKQMLDRENEWKAREERAKKFMSMMADTVVKDQKTQVLEEERKILKHYMEKEARDADEDNRRIQRLRDQKKDIKKYLDMQLEEKEKRRLQEKELEKKQADIWKKDTHDYFENEKNKGIYVRDVNKQHADYLKRQIEIERKKNKKMTPEELLLNKQRLKEIAVRDGLNFQKQLVDINQ